MGRQGPWAHRPDIRGAAVQGVGRGPEGRHETGGLRGAVRRLGQLRPQMAQDHRGRTRAVPAGPPQIHTGIHIEIRHRPKRVVSPVQDSIADAVVDRRKSHPFEGSKRIREALGLDCSTTVIDRVLRDRGLTRRRPKRRKPFYSRYESDRALDMIQLDYKQWNDRTWSIFAVDDRSRAILGLEVMDTATTDVAIALVKGVISRFGKPKRILTDHGASSRATGTRAHRDSTSSARKRTSNT